MASFRGLSACPACFLLVGGEPGEDRQGMKAAVLYGREEIRVESLEEGSLLAGEVRVRIGAALTLSLIHI